MANVKWTAVEDKIFESALVGNKDAENKWELIAELLPRKTAEEVKERRETLLMNAATTGTTEEDKLFESALKNVPEGTPGRLHEVAKAVPGRTMEEVRVHSELLMMDVDVDLNEIDFRRVELSNYDKESAREGSQKKRKPWTSEEHRKFLEGVKEFGKGEWKSISRNSVITRTPEQVKDHFRYYFGKNDRERELYNNKTKFNDGLGEQQPRRKRRRERTMVFLRCLVSWCDVNFFL